MRLVWGLLGLKVLLTILQDLMNHLTSFVEERGWQVRFNNEQGGLSEGLANNKTKEIVVGNWHNLERSLAIVLHEVEHMQLHSPDDELGGEYHTDLYARGLAELLLYLFLPLTVLTTAKMLLPIWPAGLMRLDKLR